MTFIMGRGVAMLALLVLSIAARAEQPAAAPVGSGGKAATSAAGAPDAAKPDVATLLFGTPQWGNAPSGTKVRYTYDKVVAMPSLGTSFKDEVLLTLGAGADAQSRTIEMQLFSGANRKAAGPFPSDIQNPVLLVVLEENIQELSKLFKANPRYLKNAIRKAWRDHATIEPAQDAIDG